MDYGPNGGVQGIKWAQMVNKIINMITPPGLSPRATVDSRFHGDPQGFWPAALRGRSVPKVPQPPMQGQAVGQTIVRRGARTQIFPDTHAAAEGFTPPESSDTLYYRAADPALPPHARRNQVGRHTQVPGGYRASLNAMGSSSQRSGPEGTLVLYPPFIPRLSGTRRAIGGNTGNRPPVRVVATPQITVVQAAGSYP